MKKKKNIPIRVRIYLMKRKVIKKRKRKENKKIKNKALLKKLRI